LIPLGLPGVVTQLMPRIRVILQARTTSRRLPGKALLPVAGYPAVALSALRALNLGHELVVATSADPSDDRLAEISRAQGLQVFRGSLDDVLGRFCLAAADLSDDGIIVRLTGDNVLPDGEFVRQLTHAFTNSGLEYLSATCPQSHLPYGLSAEAFSVATLRTAHARTTSSYDREHVCPWMARHCRVGIYVPAEVRGSDYSHLRCTIDDDEDYHRILGLFANVDDPVHENWYQLMVRLQSIPGEPEFRVPYRVIEGRVHSQLTLGTVQLGREYGIVNTTGKPDTSSAVSMVRTAIQYGVTTLDTARTYGDSESIIGSALTGAWESRVEVITKLDTLMSFPMSASSRDISAAVESSVAESCAALRGEKISTLLLHGWHYHDDWQGAAWRTLLRLRDLGKIDRLGASVYQPEEALAALRDPDIRHLQIPFNLLDWRWKAQGIDKAIEHRPDVLVHARSVFLQGILLNRAACWPASENLDARDCVEALNELARESNRQSLVDLCLAYVRAQPWITSLVVGCETMNQLKQNLELFRTPALTAEQCAQIERSLPKAPQMLLNPSKWKMAHA